MKIQNHLFLIFFLAISYCSFSQKKNLKFMHIGRSEGLSQSFITSIVQDNRGFMWFGSYDGLNKYDGYKITRYKYDAKNKNSLSNNNIKQVFEDSKGNLWIATGNGLNRFDKNTETFEKFIHTNSPTSLSSNAINAIAEDKSGNIWVGSTDDGENKGGLQLFDVAKKAFVLYNPSSSINITDIITTSQNQLWIGYENGILIFDIASRKFIQSLTNNPGDKNSLSEKSVTVIFEDSNHNIWVGTRNSGLELFDKKINGFRHFRKQAETTNSISNNAIITIMEDKSKNLWVGTENGGINILNLSTGVFTNYLQDESNPYSLQSNSIHASYIDAKGNVWIGTQKGIDFLDWDTKKFNHIKESRFTGGLNHNTVFCIRQGSDGTLLIATDGGGLNILNEKTNEIAYMTHEAGNKNSICGDHVISVLEDSYQNIWIGTWGDGLTVYNKNKKTYKHYKHDPTDPYSLGGIQPWTIYEDRQKNIWIGTFWGGLSLYDRKKDRFITYRKDANDPYSINSNVVGAILEDKEGNLWLGTAGGGLSMLDRKANKFTNYIHQENKNSISSNSVNSIYEDTQGNIWLATSAGLNHFNRSTNKFTVYNTENGFQNDNILSVVGDKNGNIWLNTGDGISMFNTKTKAVINYAVSANWQGGAHASFVKNNGEILMGSMDGIVQFHPDQMSDVKYDPPVVLTSFQIFNEEVPVADSLHPKSPLEKSITETKEISIPYSNSVISFEFASLNYTSESKKKYSYRLEGFDKDWNNIETKHSATYTNLDPGEYTLKIRSLNNEGEWSDKITELKITILPPFWMTWWFRISAILIVAGSTVFIIRTRFKNIKKQKKVLEQQVQERTERLALSTEQERKARLEAEKAQHDAEKARLDAEKANQAKSVFLATMSHEIRTPMNGVIGMASLLAETPLTEQQREFTETITNCGESLLNVINDILDFSKIESGNMELEETDFDLRNCIETVLDIFANKASQSGIDLLYQVDANVPSQVIGDELRLKQVLTNLIGNAMKFTQHGEVFVGVHLLSSVDKEMEIEFEVRDTGIGIPADKLERLFKAFSQVDSSTTRKYGGTGLGLAISEKLVKLMGGQIKVVSQPNFGSSFSFSIKAKASQQALRTYVHFNIPAMEGKRVLVVDDNSTNRSILKNQLEQWKLIPVLADSSEAAINTLKKSEDAFDLVISDMQMPMMDGVQLARFIKKKFPTTPIILLSSIGDESHKNYPSLFYSILTKPIKQSILYKHILGALKQADKQIFEEQTVKEKLPQNFAEKFPLKFLVAEDNLINQKLILHILNRLGFTPDMANNGMEAIEAVEQNSYDIILMDVQMPEMDGLEATELIRKQNIKQPVIIALTANTMQGDQEECIKAGMNDYISKPVKLEKLVALLEKWALQKVEA
jgi:signal transduction histidine kinase/ligand-binding sensor domain-containing protein/DNA-binding response OmpR family regulator